MLDATVVPVTYVVRGLEPMIWMVLMSSSRLPSFGVVSVTITCPGPWTVIVHWFPWRSMPETILP